MSATALADILTAVAADLEDLLEDLIDDPLPAGTLAVGRQPPKVQRPGQPTVHVRPGLKLDHAQGGGHQVKGQELEILVREKAVREGSQTGAAQVDDVRPVAEAIEELFASGPPSSVTEVEGVIGSKAEITEADQDPSEQGLLQTTVKVVVFTNGDIVEAEGP